MISHGSLRIHFRRRRTGPDAHIRRNLVSRPTLVDCRRCVPQVDDGRVSLAECLVALTRSTPTGHFCSVMGMRGCCHSFFRVPMCSNLLSYPVRLRLSSWGLVYCGRLRYSSRLLAVILYPFNQVKLIEFPIRMKSQINLKSFRFFLNLTTGWVRTGSVILITSVILIIKRERECVASSFEVISSSPTLHPLLSLLLLIHANQKFVVH